MIKCQDCGRDNLTTTRFCAGCGAQLRIELPVHDPARVLKRMRKAFARRGARERAEVRGEARQLASASRRLDLVLMVVAALTATAAWWGLSTAVVALNRPPPVVAVAPLPVPPSLPETRATGDAADAAAASAAPAGRPLVGVASDRRPALEPGGLDGTDAWGRPYGADGGLSRRAALRGAAPVPVASNEMELPAERTVEAPPPPATAARRRASSRSLAAAGRRPRALRRRSARSIPVRAAGARAGLRGSVGRGSRVPERPRR